MPYLTFSLRLTSDIAGEPALIVDYTRRVFLTEAQLFAIAKPNGDPVGSFSTISTIDYIPVLNAFILSTDSPIHVKMRSPIVPGWLANTTYVVGNQVADASGNLQQCLMPGHSGATPPAWATGIGISTTDGTVVWLCVQLSSANDAIKLKAGGILAVIDGQIDAGPALNALVSNIGPSPANLSGMAGGT